jgi:hypothetical protein
MEVTIRQCNGNKQAWIALVSNACLASSFTALSLDALIKRIKDENPAVKTVTIEL